MSKIVNIYILYDLDYCPKVPLRNYALKSCLFWGTNVEKIIIKKIMCIVATE